MTYDVKILSLKENVAYPLYFFAMWDMLFNPYPWSFLLILDVFRLLESIAVFLMFIIMFRLSTEIEPQISLFVSVIFWQASIALSSMFPRITAISISLIVIGSLY